MLNPGHNSGIKVTFFNCHGLIPFLELGKEHPELDVPKIYEQTSVPVSIAVCTTSQFQGVINDSVNFVGTHITIVMA